MEIVDGFVGADDVEKVIFHSGTVVREQGGAQAHTRSGFETRC